MGRQVTATGKLVRRLQECGRADLPAGVSIGSPSPSNTIELFVNREVFEFEIMLQSISHGNASRPGADDDGIEAFVVW